MVTVDRLKNCVLCPRRCGADRANGKTGFCGASDKIKIARSALHFWEEPCISGENGSGTVFFSHCPLKCVFCQNYEISAKSTGYEVTVDELADCFLDLERQGANNINLVTPTHYVPQLIQAIKTAKENGLTLPILYNTSGYENVETLRSLEGLIDIYMPDMKYMSDKYAVKYSNAPDYFNIASRAIAEMFRQVGKPVFKNGIMQRGVIVRHLMLPGSLFDTKHIIDYLYKTYKDDIFISLMSQYTPLEHVKKYPELDKRLNPKHYEAMLDYCADLGIKNAFIQEGDTAKESFIPSFSDKK